jgi:hypothetical protein
LAHRKEANRDFRIDLYPTTMRRIIYSLVAIGLFSFGLATVHEVNRSNQQLHIKRIELKSTELKLKELESNYNKLNTDKAQSDAERLRLEKEKQELEAQLQAKAVLKARNVAYAAEVSLSGTCADWMTQAGVSDVRSASILINKESGCNPYAVNSSSGACGIAQELPCNKSGCGLGNPVCQIQWMQSYVNARYGSWAGALSFHYSNNWY